MNRASATIPDRCLECGRKREIHEAWELFWWHYGIEVHRYAPSVDPDEQEEQP